MLIDDYEAELAALRARFGPDCKLVLLFVVGSFYEMYASVDDPGADPTGIRAVAGLLNIAVTRKSKAVLEVSRTNPLLAGIPVVAFAKYRPVLLNADYTVAIANQHEAPDGKGFVRVVDEVLSPGTWDGETADVGVGSGGQGAGSSLLVAWVEARGDWIGVGLAGVDLLTGGGGFAEAHASGRDADRALDEARQVLRAARGRELVVVPGLGSASAAAAARLLPSRSGFGACLVHVAGWAPPPEMARVAYQDAVLGKAFPAEVRGLLTPLEHLGLERSPLAAAAYATALEFAYQHDERVLARLRPPEPWALENAVPVHGADSLNIDGPPGKRSLQCILNTCKTAFGRRAFRARLLRPTSDVALIERRLDAVAAMLKGHRHEDVRRVLADVHDVERLARRVALGRAMPHEVAALAASVARAGEVVGGSDVAADVAALGSEFEGWNLEAMRRDDLASAAVDGQDPLLVALDRERATLEAGVGRIAAEVEARDEGGAGLLATRKRFEAALASGRVPGLEGRDAPAGRVRLVHADIDRRDAAARALEAGNRAAFGCLVRRLGTPEWQDAVQRIVHEVAQLDVAAACASEAVLRKYCRPTLLREGRACVDVRGMRHPIVERLLADEPYTANDLALGLNADADVDSKTGTGNGNRGLVLYGLNAAGKSTTMKALGCAVVMAQAGMFVAAERMALRPFDAVYTRIGGGDDLFAGRSAFVVEMLEIRNFVRRATCDSLVLADELCNSTESVSAVAIVAQGVATLANRGTCFVMASHLHELTQTSVFRDLPVTVGHLHVEVEEDGTIVYHRDLRPGQGETLYGLEVARALGFDAEFMAGANAVRRETLGHSQNMVNPRRSRYNAGVYVDRCVMCGKPAEEVHHLREQATADALGFVGDHHKNAAFNLVAICRECHDAEHKGAAVEGVKKAVKTSRGPRIVKKT